MVMRHELCWQVSGQVPQHRFLVYGPILFILGGLKLSA